MIGYDRYETEEELQLLNSIYDDLRLYGNYFQPVMKLIGKERVGNKTIIRYDEVATSVCYDRIRWILLERRVYAICIYSSIQWNCESVLTKKWLSCGRSLGNLFI